jgi:hypothetical protein
MDNLTILTPKQNVDILKITCKGTLRQVFIFLWPLPLLGFCLGWSRIFVGSESGQVRSVIILQNMVSNSTQHTPPPPPATHCLYIIIMYIDTGKGGGGREMKQREG